MTVEEDISVVLVDSTHAGIIDISCKAVHSEILIVEKEVSVVDDESQASSDVAYPQGPYRAWMTGNVTSSAVLSKILTVLSFRTVSLPVPHSWSGTVLLLLKHFAMHRSLFNRQLTGFGVFQDFYTTTYLTKYSVSNISWIGGVQFFLELGLAPIGGKL